MPAQQNCPSRIRAWREVGTGAALMARSVWGWRQEPEPARVEPPQAPSHQGAPTELAAGPWKTSGNREPRNTTIACSVYGKSCPGGRRLVCWTEYRPSSLQGQQPSVPGPSTKVHPQQGSNLLPLWTSTGRWLGKAQLCGSLEGWVQRGTGQPQGQGTASRDASVHSCWALHELGNRSVL